MELLDSERQVCEVWTRVMGYHRPVSDWNIGKQSEHAERKFYTEALARAETDKPRAQVEPIKHEGAPIETRKNYIELGVPA